MSMRNCKMGLLYNINVGHCQKIIAFRKGVHFYLKSSTYKIIMDPRSGIKYSLISNSIKFFIMKLPSDSIINLKMEIKSV
jgi:hypothetical protein